LPPVGQKAEKMADGHAGDCGARRQRRLVGEVGGGGGDPQDDAVAMVDLEGKRWTWGAMLDRYAEALAVEGMARIDDRDSLNGLILAVFAARGIKKIPRSTAYRPWSGTTSPGTP
jgi:hypothetical protein